MTRQSLVPSFFAMALISHCSKEEFDGEIVVCTPGDRSDLISVAAATVWTGTHVTLTHLERCGASTVGLEREVLERIIGLCPLGQGMTISLQDSRLDDEANRANSPQLTPEEVPKWAKTTRVMQEGRRISIAGYVDGSTNEFSWHLTEEYAEETLEKVEPSGAVRALGGEEALLAPR
jgi:hypothetical protein